MTPRQGGRGRLLDADFLPEVEAGLSLAYGLELAAVHGEAVQPAWQWPRAWLGFASAETAFDAVVAGEGYGEGLYAEALQMLQSWLDAGCPDDRWPGDTTHLGRLLPALASRRFHAWPQVEHVLDGGEAQFLADEAFVAAARERDGLVYVPAGFYRSGSPSRPVDLARRVMLELPARLMRREVVVPEGPAGFKAAYDPLAARVQTRVVGRGADVAGLLCGHDAATDWDLLSPGPGRDFRPGL